MKAEYIDHLGDDLTVVNAARVSFDRESHWEVGTDYLKLPDGDERLIKYLATHKHWTPFAHPAITMRETIPIFLARQRFKHQIGFVYNEVSRRYVDDIPEFFVPLSWRERAENKKQGSGNDLSQTFQDELNQDLLVHHQACMSLYLSMLDRKVCPEQARMVLPQSMLTSYYVTGSLAAWARAYNLRIDTGHAQKEWEVMTEQWNGIIRPLFPVSWKYLINE